MPRDHYEERIYCVYMLASQKNGTLYIGDVQAAIQREKTMKKWPRAWKLNLINEANPSWDDLFLALLGPQIEDSVQNFSFGDGVKVGK